MYLVVRFQLRDANSLGHGVCVLAEARGRRRHCTCGLVAYDTGIRILRAKSIAPWPVICALCAISVMHPCARNDCADGY